VTECYVGHTTNFTNRKNKHKENCTKNYTYSHLKVYEMMRANGGWENWTMIEIEKYPCKDFNEARARERYWYEILNSKLNSVRPFVSTEERKDYLKLYREQNKGNNKIYYKNLYQNNKEEILLKQKNILSK
jgi:hypothetical protein